MARGEEFSPAETFESVFTDSVLRRFKAEMYQDLVLEFHSIIRFKSKSKKRERLAKLGLGICTMAVGDIHEAAHLLAPMGDFPLLDLICSLTPKRKDRWVSLVSALCDIKEYERAEQLALGFRQRKETSNEQMLQLRLLLERIETEKATHKRGLMGPRHRRIRPTRKIFTRTNLILSGFVIAVTIVGLGIYTFLGMGVTSEAEANLMRGLASATALEYVKADPDKPRVPAGIDAYLTESIKLADQVLERHPEHVKALCIKTYAMYARARLEPDAAARGKLEQDADAVKQRLTAADKSGTAYTKFESACQARIRDLQGGVLRRLK